MKASKHVHSSKMSMAHLVPSAGKNPPSQQKRGKAIKTKKKNNNNNNNKWKKERCSQC